MKYTIFGFSQKKLVELGLDLIDAAILRELIDFKATGKMVCRDLDGEEWFWVKYQGLINQLPISKLTTRNSIYRRLTRLVDAGALKHKTVKREGTYSFYQFGDAISSLMYLSDENEEGVRMKTKTGTDENEDQKTLLSKDSSIKEHSTADVIETRREQSNPKPLSLISKEKQISASAIADSRFCSAWGMYDKKGNKATALRYWAKLKPEDHEAIIKAIPPYKASVSERVFMKDFQGWINPTNRMWEDEVVEQVQEPGLDSSIY